MTGLSLQLPIKPGVGVGDLILGLPAGEVLGAAMEMPVSDIEVAAHYPRLFEYRYRHSLSLYIDIVGARLVRIDMTGDFSGDTRGITVGSTVAQFRDVFDDVTWDEDWIIAGPDYGLTGRLEVGGDIGDIDDVLDERITVLSIELPNWQRSPTDPA